MHKKCTKKCAKSSFILQILMSIKTRFSCFVSLLFHYQWNASIFSSLATFLKFSTILFYCIRTNWKCNKKVQYFCCALTCCTFSRKILVTVFSLGYILGDCFQTSSKLNVILHLQFVHTFTFLSTKSIIEQLQSD